MILSRGEGRSGRQRDIHTHSPIAYMIDELSERMVENGIKREAEVLSDDLTRERETIK
jgi:hypothetical protein